MRVEGKYFCILKRRYHQLRPVLWDDLYAAHRAIADCLESLFHEAA